MAAAVVVMQSMIGETIDAATHTTATAAKTVDSVPSQREVLSPSSMAQSSTVPSTAPKTVSGKRMRSFTSPQISRKNASGERASSSL